MSANRLVQILEAILLSAGQPLTVKALGELFEISERPDKTDIEAALAELAMECESRSYALQEVASGYRLQIRAEFSPWISRLWEEKPPRYSRALLETLALIAYRQPITRGEIEEIRGVSVSSKIIHTMLEREWIRVVGRKEVPGRPSLFGTTRQFLDYFNLKQLTDLPPLAEVEKIELPGFAAEPAAAREPETSTAPDAEELGQE